jgi:preprotein translocase subunit YajC
MLGSLATFFVMFAQAGAAPGHAGAKSEPSLLTQLLPFSAVPIIFYLILIRPQQQQEKKRREMMEKLKKNDKVLTLSGMYGTVVSVDETGDRVQLRLDDDGKLKVTFTRASIVRVLNDSSEKSTETK